MQDTNLILNNKWNKAAVIGSLWASIEILAGSFLHNIKFPLSGTLLSMLSVMLMAAFLMVWNEKYIIWRAALITALMKSISPSAVILGPMTGIFTEGLLMELALILFGTRKFGILIGGALAVFSTILHKTVTLLILYGFDLVTILKNLYYFAVKQIGFEDFSPIWLIGILSLIYFSGGFIAAFIGVKTGKTFLEQKKKNKLFFNKDNLLYKKAFETNQKQNFSAWLILLHIILLVVGILIINNYSLLYSTIFTAFYIVLIFLRYNSSIRHLKKISFWLQAIVVTFLAAVFLNDIHSGTILSATGIIYGVKLIFRVIIIVMGFSAISIELRNPVIQYLIKNKGYQNLYNSVKLAFSVLPFIFDNLPGIKESIKKPQFLLTQILELSTIIYHSLYDKPPTVFVVYGNKQEGKTTFVQNLAKQFKASEIKLAGFLALGIHDKQGNRIGFKLHFLHNDDEIGLCSVSPKKGWIHTGKYYCNPAVFDYGIKKLKNTDADIFIIDEVGPVELSGEGWFRLIKLLFRKKEALQIWTVRESLLNQLETTFPDVKFQYFHISENTAEILKHIKNEVAITEWS